jgi:LysR family glycine cleavage system transcriptional activator
MDTRTRPFLFDGTGFDAAIYCGDAGWPGTEALYLLGENLVPVCSPRLLGARRRVTAAAIAAMPLLQQSTRPYSWRRWFASLGMRVARDMSGPRFELFSMLAHAAVHDLGVALVPPMMVEEELACGSLVIPFAHEYESERAYYLIFPEASLERPGFVVFRDWLFAETEQYNARSAVAPKLPVKPSKDAGRAGISK